MLNIITGKTVTKSDLFLQTPLKQVTKSNKQKFEPISLLTKSCQHATTGTKIGIGFNGKQCHLKVLQIWLLYDSGFRSKGIILRGIQM